MSRYNKSEPSYFESAIGRAARMLAASLILVLVIGTSVWAKAPESIEVSGSDLTELSLEDLMNIEVTSVSKKSQRLADAPAAVFVITQEDIRRSGVTSIPEALRMVPGLQVARINANTWAITARGFNGRFANKLLVLMDGRSVYTPIFSGVFWDVQDTLMEDIDRIEVIRGPGASLWGANAVNGVINIITKAARETQGGLVSAGGGTEERGFGSVRYGDSLGESAHYRMYAKYLNRDSSVDAFGKEGKDDWDMLRGGFRMDWDASDRNLLTVQGDIYRGDSSGELTEFFPTFPFISTIEDKSINSGGNILAKWKHTISNTSDTELKFYYDREQRDTFYVNTVDLDFQHRFMPFERHEIIWGLGYRYINDKFENRFSFFFEPQSRSVDLFSGFVQDEITLFPDKLRLTVGSKFEHNDFTGFEIQPNARILWTPAEDHSVWAAVSRAVRTPSLGEEDARAINGVVFPNTLFPGSPVTFVTLNGTRDFESEALIAYEAGYRFQPIEGLSTDISVFYNDYDNLRTIEPIDPFTFTAGNNMKGETYGVELAADWRPCDWWRLQGAYTYLQMALKLDADSRDTQSKMAEDEIPHHQASLRSSVELPANLELDLWLRYVDELSAQEVDDYLTLDMRVGWKPIKNLEVSLVGQNLLENHHPEFRPEILGVPPAEIERGVYGKITWGF